MPMTRRVALGAALSLPFAPPVRAQEVGTAARPLRVGVTSGVHAQVLERVRDLVQPGGLTLRITEFSDFIQPNAALAGGKRIEVILYEQAEVVRHVRREQPEGDGG